MDAEERLGETSTEKELRALLEPEGRAVDRVKTAVWQGAVATRNRSRVRPRLVAVGGAALVVVIALLGWRLGSRARHGAESWSPQESVESVTVGGVLARRTQDGIWTITQGAHEQSQPRGSLLLVARLEPRIEDPQPAGEQR